MTLTDLAARQSTRGVSSMVAIRGHMRCRAALFRLGLAAALLGCTTLSANGRDRPQDRLEQAQRALSVDHPITNARRLGPITKVQPKSDISLAKQSLVLPKGQNYIVLFINFIDAHGAAFEALSSLLLTSFTFGLLIVGYFQYKRLADTIELARNEFNATHRPEVIVHAITAPMDMSAFAMDDPRIGAFVLFFNKGVTEARITRITARISREHSPIQSGLHVHDEVLVRHIRLAPGIKDYFRLSSDFSQSQEQRLQSNPDSGYNPLCCMGVVAYEDVRGVRRETAFCYRYDVDTDRWMKANEPEYEYAY